MIGWQWGGEESEIPASTLIVNQVAKVDEDKERLAVKNAVKLDKWRLSRGPLSGRLQD